MVNNILLCTVSRIAQYFVINRRIFYSLFTFDPCIMVELWSFFHCHTLITFIVVIWSISLQLLFSCFLSSHRVQHVLGFLHHWERENSRYEALRTTKNPSHWGGLVTSFFVPFPGVNTYKIIYILSFPLDIWRNFYFFLLFNCFTA